MSVKRIIKKSFNKFGYNVSKIDPGIEPEGEIQVFDIKKKLICGEVLSAGWINVDIMSIKKIETYGSIYYQMDLTKRHLFPTESLEFAFAEDFLEHLDQADAVIFLTEIYRTLKKQGVLRLSFPGFFEVLAQHFSQPSYEQAKEMKAEAYLDIRTSIFSAFEELKQLCKQIGFTDVQLVEYGKSNYIELTNIETKLYQIGVNLHVEITK